MFTYIYMYIYIYIYICIYIYVYIYTFQEVVFERSAEDPKSARLDMLGCIEVAAGTWCIEQCQIRSAGVRHVLQSTAVCCSVLQCVAVCCSVLQCVAVCCSVLQCVAVCCSVLQCAYRAVPDSFSRCPHSQEKQSLKDPFRLTSFWPCRSRNRGQGRCAHQQHPKPLIPNTKP